jgi:phosphoglycerol transferase MdoB-like AlkP superfamily enzyme
MTKQPLLGPRSSFLLFVVSWLVIIAVAGFDSYLTVKHSPVMEDVEINPVGDMILRSTGGVPLLIGMKTAGAALALLFSMALWQWERLRARVLVSSASVATLAIGMVGFMHIDSVGMQTSQWAKEAAARRMVISPDSDAHPNTSVQKIPLNSLRGADSTLSDQSQVFQVQPAKIAPVSIDRIDDNGREAVRT